MNFKYIYNAVLVLCFANCGQNKNENLAKNDSLSSYKLDTSTIAIIPFDSVNNWEFKKGKKTKLSNNELSEIEKILSECISKFNSHSLQYENSYSTFGNDSILLKNYFRQYAPFINEKGEKIVFINFFCKESAVRLSKEDKKNIVHVSDGGKCFFHVKINLITKNYFDFFVNWEA